MLSYLQLFSSENLFSLIDIVLAAAGWAFTRITVEQSFKETGLVPFSPSKIRKLAKKNHPQVANLEREQHLREHKKLVEDTMQSIEKVFQACQKESEKKAKQVQKVKATIKKNQVYNVVEILKAADADKEGKKRRKSKERRGRKRSQREEKEVEEEKAWKKQAREVQAAKAAAEKQARDTC